MLAHPSITDPKLTYEPSAIPALVVTLNDLFERNPAMIAFISATVRNPQTIATFLKNCSKPALRPSIPSLMVDCRLSGLRGRGDRLR